MYERVRERDLERGEERVSVRGTERDQYTLYKQAGPNSHDE